MDAGNDYDPSCTQNREFSRVWDIFMEECSTTKTTSSLEKGDGRLKFLYKCLVKCIIVKKL